MARVPIYRTDEGENFTVLSKFAYHQDTYFMILNFLDECLCQNNLMRLPIIEARKPNSFKSPIKLIGYISVQNFKFIFWPTVQRLRDSQIDRLSSELETKMMLELFKELDQSLSSASLVPSNSDPASYSQLCY